jgi:hypothetical protein
MGCYFTAEVMGAEAIMTTILEPTRRRTYGMCGTFCSVLLGHHFSDSR